MPSTSANFNGIPENACECVPPDPSGAAGPNQYVEVANTDLAVYSKTGTALLGPEATNTLWSGFGGGCETNNDGDGTVLFDTISQRWVVQQFSVRTTPYLDCVAVSETSDATGKWHRYSFQYEKFPDYPKMGVWSDAYYASFNLFNSGFVGAEACAFNRAAMLKGEAATQQCFVGTEKGGASLLPATLDGTTQPPSGEPEWFVALSPTEAKALAYWKFHVDWSNPANTTFTGPTNLPVEAFSQACGGGACVPQAETSNQLDSLGDRLMFRLAYRNFGGHESMVVAHAVTAGSSVGMRWYELRPSSGSLTVYQQGTYAPDSAYRWMGSIAMDKSGDMALGYSASSSSLHPQIRYTGRLVGDPLGTMPQGEATLYEGPGSQTSYVRWGDYTEMSVDPSDECTFWYVNEYLPSNGSFNWHTRIGSFKFPSCGSPPSATTEPASYTNTFEPQLNAIVNPEGTDTHYQFEYGLTESYGSKIPVAPEDIGSGTTAVAVSKTLSGLERNKTYHFRVVAESAAGTTHGTDKSFTTLPPCKGAEEKCLWSTQTTPNSPPHTEDKMTGVACVSSTNCVAVGKNSYTEGGFVEVWNGAEWKIKWELNGYTGNFLGISCGSTTSCMVIGETQNSGELRSEKLTYSEFLGEGKWNIEYHSVPAPSGGTQLKAGAISCASSTFCMAVGSYYNEGVKDLVETWNGSAWSVQSPPAEGNATSAMRSVSCPSATSCITVGELSSKPTAEHWNGTEWSLITPPNPTGAVGASLEGVSCPSTTSCMAVGNFHESGKENKTLTESWNGSAWSVKSSPNPEAKYGSTLLGVSCLSSTSCFAVGDYSTEVFKLKTLAETWNGTEWTIKSSPNPTGSTSSSLVSDSCTSSIACTAVGSASPGPSGETTVTLAERWNGTEWSTQTTPNSPPHTEDKMTGVACVSSTNCVAVGKNSYTEGGFVEVWNGAEWKIKWELNGYTGNFLGISCGSTTSCMVIGETQNSGELRSEKLTYSEFLGEGKWNIEYHSVPAPSGGTQLKAGAISCASSTFCMAVGSYYNEGVKDLVETWNGSAWSVQSPPAEGNATSAMRSVSCPSATSCITVGELSSKPTAEHWNGTEWSLITPPNPTGAVGASLEGVSCPSTTSCMAVGNFHESGKENKTLTESWNGSAWSVKSSPNPEAKYGSTLLGVSCLSSTSCFAVGDYSTEVFKLKTLAETWNGTEWTIKSSPNPTGSTSSSLVSDSCTSSIACTAVGSASPGPSGETTVTLAERYE